MLFNDALSFRFYTASVMNECIWRGGKMIRAGENPEVRCENRCNSATVPTTNQMQSNQGSSVGLRCETPVTPASDHLRHGKTEMLLSNWKVTPRL